MFSIVVPVYNKLPHLERSINSVLSQTFQDFELILVDDASTDGSSDKLKEFSDPRIKLLKRDTPGPGGYAARNLGIEVAKFDWISFLDADDEWDVNYLYEVSHQIAAVPQAEVISCKWKTVPDNKRENKSHQKLQAGSFTLIDYLYNPEYMWTSAITIKKSLFRDSGRFPAGRCNRGGDLDTWIRVLYKSQTNIYIDRALAYYYKDSVNRVTNENVNTSSFYALETLKRIKKSSSNRNLLEAIDFYITRKVYSVLSARARSNGPIDYVVLEEVHPISSRILIRYKVKAKRIYHRFLK